MLLLKLMLQLVRVRRPFAQMAPLPLVVPLCRGFEAKLVLLVLPAHRALLVPRAPKVLPVLLVLRGPLA
jgi:hypothetical protein